MTTASALSGRYRPVLLLALITLHLFIMNGFYPTHRQLTVGTYFTSIRNFADPSLYANSIYVQAVNRTNLRISLAYDAMPFILQYIDFELFGILQGVVSIFFIVAGLYRLAFLWFGNTTAAYLSALLYTPALNNWTLGSPAPYLNFYHHGLPLTYPLIIWSMVFFWQKRFLLACMLAGCSWNFHPMCTAFLMFAYGTYWLVNLRAFAGWRAGMYVLSFVVPALPTILKSFTHIGASGGSGALWLQGVAWVAGYTCFPSEWPLPWFIRAGLFFILFWLCYSRIRDAVLRQWIAVFILSVLALCLAGTVFADIVPVPFIIKASLWRSSVIYLFIAIPCIAWMISQLYALSMLHRFAGISLAVLLTGYVPNFGFWHLPFYIGLIIWLLYRNGTAKKNILSRPANIAAVVLTLLSAFVCARMYGKPTAGPAVAVLGALLSAVLFQVLHTRGLLYNRLWQAACFIMVFDAAILWHNGGPDIYFHGNIKGRTDLWADVQKYARTVSNKDDLFIVPPYMNDFSLYSYRAVLGDWAEGSTLVYLDNEFTKEWFERMHDLGWTEKHLWYDGYNRLTTTDVLRAARKYGADFIVTEKPKTFNLRKIYENDKFILYRADA